MSKRKRDDDEETAVFVDTNLNTHLVVLVSPLHTFSLLKKQIVDEHSKCFPSFGKINITALKVKREENYYHLPESMLLRTAFHGAAGWFVFADVAGTPVNSPTEAQSIPLRNSQPKQTIFDKKPLLHKPKDPSINLVGNPVVEPLKAGDFGAIKSDQKKKKKKPIKDKLKVASNNLVGDPVIEPLKAGDFGAIQTDNKKRKKKHTEDELESASNKLVGTPVVELLEAGDCQAVKFAEKTNKKKKHAKDKLKGSATDECLASDITAGKKCKFESNVAPETSVMETNGVMSGFTPATSELKTSVNCSDNQQNNGLPSCSVLSSSTKQNNDQESADMRQQDADSLQPAYLPSKAPETATDNELVEKEKRNAGDDAVVHFHYAPSIAIDGASEAKTGVATELQIQQEGTKSPARTLNHDSGVDNAGAAAGNVAKKKKAIKAKSSVTEWQDTSIARQSKDQESADRSPELLQPAEFSTHTQNVEGTARRRTRSQNKLIPGKDSIELPGKEQLNETIKELAAPETANEDGLTNMKMNDSGSKSRICHAELNENSEKVPASLAKGDIQTSKKGKEKAGTQQMIDIPKAVDETHIGRELLQSDVIRKPGENGEATRERPKKRSQNRKTVSARDTPEIPEREVDCGPMENKSMNGAKQQKESGEGLEELNEIPLQETPTDVDEESNLDKPKTSKTKRKKLDQPSSIDTLNDSNAVVSKKSQDRGRTSQVEKQLRSDAFDEMNEISRPKTPADLAEVSHCDEPPTTKKAKRKKLDQPSSIDKPNDHDAVSSKNNQDRGRTSQVEKQLHSDAFNGLNEIPRQKTPAESVALSDLDKPLTSKKTKKKKLDQPSSTDTSKDYNAASSKKNLDRERTSQVEKQLGFESLLSPQVEKSKLSMDTQNDKSKKREQKKQSGTAEDLSKLLVKQQLDADDLLLVSDGDAKRQKEASVDKRQHDDLSEIPHVDVHDGLAEMKNLEKQVASKQKKKKLVLPSSVDTGVKSVKSKGNEHSVQVSPEVQNDIQVSEQMKENPSEFLQVYQVNESEAHPEVSNDKVEKKRRRKHIATKGLIRPPAPQQLDGNKLDTDVSKLVDHADVVSPSNDSSVAKHKKGSLPEGGHHSNVNEIPFLKKFSVADEARKLEKPRATEQKVNENDMPSSVDTTSKPSAKPSAVLKEVVDSAPFDGPAKSVGRAHSQNNSTRSSVPCASDDAGSKSSGTSDVSSGSSSERNHQGKKSREVRTKRREDRAGLKTIAHKNVGEVVNATLQKKGLSATSGALFGDVSSGSSEDDEKVQHSNSSTRTPSENLSSSDYSEGESRGDVVTSQHGTSRADGKVKTIPKDSKVPLLSILKSSSRYRKIKQRQVVQSQMEDGESQVPEFVPDSQADT